MKVKYLKDWILDNCGQCNGIQNNFSLTFGGPTAKKAIFLYHIIFTADLWPFGSLQLSSVFSGVLLVKKIYCPLEFTQTSNAVSLSLNYCAYDTNLVKQT